MINPSASNNYFARRCSIILLEKGAIPFRLGCQWFRCLEIIGSGIEDLVCVFRSGEIG